MANEVDNKDNDSIIIREEPTVWKIKSIKHLRRFWRWIQKKKLIPGDVIPKRIFKRYYKNRYTKIRNGG